jgi:hypothetical protein
MKQLFTFAPGANSSFILTTTVDMSQTSRAN